MFDTFVPSYRIVCRVEAVVGPLSGPITAHVEANSIDPVYRVNGTNNDFSFSFMVRHSFVVL